MFDPLENQYETARRTAIWIRRLGAVIVFICLVFVTSALGQMISKRTDMLGVDLSFNPIVLTASLFVGMCGLLLIALGAAIPPLADLAESNKKLAENTRRLVPPASAAPTPSLAELAESNRELAENLKRWIPIAHPSVTYENNQKTEREYASARGDLDSEILFNAILRGYPWSKYADGRVEANLPGGKRIFKNFDEFESYVDAIGAN
jgi:hypothetical protein